MSQFACLALALSQTSGYSKEIFEPHAMSPLFMDCRVSPTLDFYRYSNGSWLDLIRMNQSESEVSASSQARGRNAGIVRSLVEIAASESSREPGSIEQLVGEFYRVGMDRRLADRVGIRPLDAELKRIAAIESPRDVMAELGRLHRWSINAGFSVCPQFDPKDSTHKVISLQAPRLSLRSPSPYLQSDSHSQELQAILRRSIERTLSLLGDSTDSLSQSSNSVLNLEKKLAEASPESQDSIDDSENKSSLSVSQLGSAVPLVDWWIYFERLGLPVPEHLRVANLAYLGAFGKVLRNTSVTDWKTYLRWMLVLETGPFLSEAFATEAFRVKAAIGGQQEAEPRNQLVLSQTDASLGCELGALLAKTQFSMKAKAKVLSMIGAIRGSLRDTISLTEWMSPIAKSKALEKLTLLRVDVCYPEHTRRTNGLAISNDSYVQNVLRSREFAFQQGLDSLPYPVDRNEWDVRAYMVDAHYNINLNLMILPAGILQAPYFDPDADDASNFGALGAVIGHEFMHAFDDRGRKYDSAGNLNDWWCKSDELRFKEYEHGIATQYAAYQTLDKINLNGRQTLAENIADLGGVRVAYRAFKKFEALHGSQIIGRFTPDQRFFISYGQIFRSKIRPETLRYGIENDLHSPPQFRVKGVLQNVPEFWRAFHAAPPASMLSIW